LSEREAPSERIFKTLIKEEIRKLNLHLPKNRKSLKELLSENDPYVEAVDGSKIFLKKRDLDSAAKIIPESHQNLLRLPIVIFRRMEMGRGIFTVFGDETEKFFVRKALGLTEQWKGGEVYLYRVQVQELLSKFKSLISIGFGVPEDLDF
jgi:uncharacterized protein (UPF0216 family)